MLFELHGGINTFDLWSALKSSTAIRSIIDHPGSSLFSATYWLCILTACKIGETIYKCRTCQSEYQAAPEVCEECHNRNSQKHAGHDWARLTCVPSTDIPDDREIQLQNWWRCAFPGCGLGMCMNTSLHILTSIIQTTLTDTVTGPQVEWQHKHPDAVICIGDAVADFQRQTVPLGCPKTALQRMRLKDPPNATNMKCDICLKGSSSTPLKTSIR